MKKLGLKYQSSYARCILIFEAMFIQYLSVFLLHERFEVIRRMDSSVYPEELRGKNHNAAT